MDHRWTGRFMFCMNVVINYSPLGLISGKTRNISLQGMFVEIPNIYLGSEEDIEVTFSLPFSKTPQSACVKARVVHSSDNGIGIKLHNYQLGYL